MDHTRIVMRGTWVQIPLSYSYSFLISPEVVQCRVSLNSLSKLLNLDCESICDPPGGDR